MYRQPEIISNFSMNPVYDLDINWSHGEGGGNLSSPFVPPEKWRNNLQNVDNVYFIIKPESILLL